MSGPHEPHVVVRYERLHPESGVARNNHHDLRPRLDDTVARMHGEVLHDPGDGRDERMPRPALARLADVLTEHDHPPPYGGKLGPPFPEVLGDRAFLLGKKRCEGSLRLRDLAIPVVNVTFELDQLLPLVEQPDPGAMLRGVQGIVHLGPLAQDRQQLLECLHLRPQGSDLRPAFRDSPVQLVETGPVRLELIGDEPLVDGDDLGGRAAWRIERLPPPPAEQSLEARGFHRLDRKLGGQLGEVRIDEGGVELDQDVARVDDAPLLDRDPLHLALLEGLDGLDQSHRDDPPGRRRRNLHLGDRGPDHGRHQERGEQGHQEKLGPHRRHRHHRLPAATATGGRASAATAGPVTNPSASTGSSSTIREK